MCYRSVQASTIYSYLFCSNLALRISYAMWKHLRNVQWECNIDHDNVFHSRSDSRCNVRFSGDQYRRNQQIWELDKKIITICELRVGHWSHANRTDGTDKATKWNTSDVCCVISTSANTRRRIVIYKYDDSQHPSDWIVNKKEKRNNLSVTGLHLLSRSRLTYRHILIMLSFSDRFRLTTRNISSKMALRVLNR